MAMNGNKHYRIKTEMQRIIKENGGKLTAWDIYDALFEKHPRVVGTQKHNGKVYKIKKLVRFKHVPGKESINRYLQDTKYFKVLHTWCGSRRTVYGVNE